MFNINDFNNLEPLKIYLVKPDKTLICRLDRFIDKDTAQLSPAFNQMYDITFDLYRYINDENGKRLELNWYEYVADGMYLAVEKYGLFRLSNPVSVNDRTTEHKQVTATTCDCELKAKSFKYGINLGTETSLEYLVVYDDGEQEQLLDAYSGIPCDWIVLYNTFSEQLTKFKDKLNSGYYGSFLDSKIDVIDTDLISEITEIISNIKRIKRTIAYDENGNVTSCTENFEYTYDESGENIIQITIYDSVLARINDLIEFYDKYGKQLSLLDIICGLTDNTWTIGEIYGLSDGDYTLANKRFQFDADENIYSFLTQTLAEAMGCIPQFDIINRKINIYPIENIGVNTGSVLNFNNLVKSLNIDCDDNDLVTRLYVYGSDDLNISQVNFGEEYIEDLTYIVNSKDSDGNRIYVSDELAEKYLQFKQYQEENREEYITLTKEYNGYIKEIDELKYRVPNDSLSTNWGSYTEDELNVELTSYKNLLNALISLYKEDYGTIGINSDGSVNEKYLKTTEYWYDYYAYQNIINQINVAIATYPNYNNESVWTDSQKNDFAELKKSYQTEWSLYGSAELQTKIDSFKGRMSILISSGSVIKKSGTEFEIKKWSNLTSTEKKNFASEGSYTESYDMYMEYYNNTINAQLCLDSVLSKINELSEKQTICQTEIISIKNNTSWNEYFSQDERKILNTLLHDGEYTNDNIIITSLNDVVDSVDVMKELLLDSQEKISILSHPQLVFSTDLANVFGLIEFEPLWENFELGNFLLVQYQDNLFAKLRLTGYSFNPLIPSTEEMDVSFSNLVISKSKIDDSASLLGNASTDGISTFSSSSSGGSSSGIDFSISNTMLKKLLSSETFGTRVNNVILDTMELNVLGAKKAIFGSLANGQVIVDGKCLQAGYIVDKTYDGTDGSIDNTKGSILNLENGKFNFAGGRIIFDGSKLKFGSDVELSWSQVTGTDNIATKDDIDNAIIDAGGITSDQVTEIARNEIKSAKIGANQIYGNTLTLGGAGNANGILVINDADGNAIVTGNKDGLVINRGTISWENVTGTDNVATTDDILTEEQITQITKNTVTTTYINALEVTAKKVSSDWVYTGNIKASQISGDTLTLGGNNNTNGQLVIKDASGNTIVTGNSNGLKGDNFSIGADGNVSLKGDITANGKIEVSRDSLVATLSFESSDIEMIGGFSYTPGKVTATSVSRTNCKHFTIDAAEGLLLKLLVANYISSASIAAESIAADNINFVKIGGNEVECDTLTVHEMVDTTTVDVTLNPEYFSNQGGSIRAYPFLGMVVWHKTFTLGEDLPANTNIQVGTINAAYAPVQMVYLSAGIGLTPTILFVKADGTITVCVAAKRSAGDYLRVSGCYFYK